MTPFFWPIVLVTLIRASQIIYSTVPFVPNQPVQYILGLQGIQACAQALLISLAATFFFSYPFPRVFKHHLTWGLTALCAYASFSLFYWDSRLFSNPAMAAVCAVSLLPIAMKQLRVWVLPLMGIAAYGVYETNEKIGLGLFALLTVLATWNLRLRKTSGLLGLGLIVLGLVHLPTLRYHWDDRMKTWDLMFFHAWDHAFWFGFGPGSAWSSVRYLQQQAFGKIPEAFLMAHNDYLQLFYELGIVGLCAGLFAWGRVLIRAWGRPELRATLLCFSAAAVVHFPLHDPLSLVAVMGSAWLAVNVRLNESFRGNP